MIDDLTVRLTTKPPREAIKQTQKPFSWNGLSFLPKYHRTGLLYYVSSLSNLRMMIIRDQVYISNSWHKFSNGNNFSDYSLSRIEKTYYDLENRIGLSLEKGIVRKIAYGIVIDDNPQMNFPKWLFYKSKKPVPMIKNGHTYGTKFYCNDFTIKGYDKTFEVWRHNHQRIKENQFRIETEVMNMRHLHKRKGSIYLISPKDLFNFEVLQQLSNDLLMKYQKIIKRPAIDLNGLSIKKLNIIASMQNSEIRDQIRKSHNKSYKRYMQDFEALSRNGNDHYFEVEDKIKSKISELLNN